MDSKYKCTGTHNANLCKSCVKYCKSCVKYLAPFKHPQTWLNPAILDGVCINYVDVNADYKEDLKDVFRNMGLGF